MLLVTLLCGSIVSPVSAKRIITYQYTDLFNLALFKDGVDAFIDLIKKEPIEQYSESLKDVVGLSLLNRADTSRLLSDLVCNLSARIGRINRVEGKKYDTFDVTWNTVFLAQAVFLGVCAYVIVHIEDFIPVLKDNQTTEKSDADIKSDEQPEVNRMARYPLKGLIKAGFVALYGFIAIMLAKESIPHIFNGLFRVHHDDQYINAYTVLLDRTNALMENITPDKDRLCTFRRSPLVFF